ncbi:hypothetical protein RZS08_50815, partial [Arthrospira platensis SPKY1]|nr:hypothetical protein [Arthrospira platensis SPKY1]
LIAGRGLDGVGQRALARPGGAEKKNGFHERALAPRAQASFLEEPVVVAGDQVRLDLAHGIEHHADDDQHARAAEEGGDDPGDAELLGHDGRQHGDHGQEDGAGEGDAGHGA